VARPTPPGGGSGGGGGGGGTTTSPDGGNGGGAAMVEVAHDDAKTVSLGKVTLTPTENGKKTQVTIQLIIPATDALDIAGAKILNDPSNVFLFEFLNDGNPTVTTDSNGDPARPTRSF